MKSPLYREQALCRGLFGLYLQRNKIPSEIIVLYSFVKSGKLILISKECRDL